MSEESERLRVVLELAAAGEEMRRQNLRRRFPEASQEEVERRLTEWFLMSRAGDLPDGTFRPGKWPRR